MITKYPSCELNCWVLRNVSCIDCLRDQRRPTGTYGMIEKGENLWSYYSWIVFFVDVAYTADIASVLCLPTIDSNWFQQNARAFYSIKLTFKKEPMGGH